MNDNTEFNFQFEIDGTKSQLDKNPSSGNLINDFESNIDKTDLEISSKLQNTPKREVKSYKINNRDIQNRDI